MRRHVTEYPSLLTTLVALFGLGLAVPMFLYGLPMMWNLYCSDAQCVIYEGPIYGKSWHPFQSTFEFSRDILSNVSVEQKPDSPSRLVVELEGEQNMTFSIFEKPRYQWRQELATWEEAKTSSSPFSIEVSSWFGVILLGPVVLFTLVCLYLLFGRGMVYSSIGANGSQIHVVTFRFLRWSESLTSLDDRPYLEMRERSHRSSNNRYWSDFHFILISELGELSLNVNGRFRDNPSEAKRYVEQLSADLKIPLGRQILPGSIRNGLGARFGKYDQNTHDRPFGGGFSG